MENINLSNNEVNENTLNEKYKENSTVYSAWDEPSYSAGASVKVKVINSTVNRVIQNFYMGSDYLYNTNQDGNGSFYIYKSKLNNVKDEAIYTSNLNGCNYMKITNGGHGSTLSEISNKNGEISFLITTGAIYINAHYYSSEIGMVTYNKDNPQNIDNSNISKIKDIKYANKANIACGEKLRSVSAALTPDKSQILIFARLIDEKSNNIAQYSIYNFDVIKETLINNKISSFASNPTLTKACQLSTIQTGSGIMLPNNNFQGIAISNESNNKHNIYIASGSGDSNSKLMIAKLTCNKSASSESSKLVYNESVRVALPSNLTSDSKLTYELEGIHINGNKLYVGVSPHGTGVNKTTSYICSINKF